MYEYGNGLSLSGSGLGLSMQSRGLGLQVPDTLLTSGSAAPAASAAPSSFNMGTLGLGMQAIGAINSAISSFYSTRAQMSSLRFQADMAEINARMAERGAQSMLEQGQRQVGQLTLRAGQMKSAQRAALAANGVDLSVGSAAEIVASTDIMKEIDKNTIEANAVRSAWGYRTQATSLSNDALMRRGAADSMSPVSSTINSLLNNAGGVASSWYQMRKSGAFNSPSNG